MPSTIGTSKLEFNFLPPRKDGEVVYEPRIPSELVLGDWVRVVVTRAELAVLHINSCYDELITGCWQITEDQSPSRRCRLNNGFFVNRVYLHKIEG